MKTINKILYAAAGALLLGFAACTEEVEYTPAGVPDGAQVYWADTRATIDLERDSVYYNIPVGRIATDEGLTVAVSVSGNDSAFFTIPEEVTFQAGEKIAGLTIGYDLETLGFGNYVALTFALGSETTPYGADTYTVKLGIPAPWNSLGMATYREDILTTFWNVGNQVYSVEIQENDLTPGYYRLVNPYGAAYPWNEEGDWDDSQDWYLEIHAENPNAVYITAQQTGIDWGYGNIEINSMAGYYLEGGNALEAIAAAGYCGTLVDGIITFPTKGLLLHMPDYDDGWYYGNLNGMFAVALPGIVLGDFSLDVAYSGTYTNTNGDTKGAIANLSTIGEDIDEVQVALVAGDDVEAAAEQIANGEISYETVTAPGQVLIPFSAVPEDGTYTIVAVGYSNGEVKAIASASFEFTSAPSEWKTLGTATYREDFMASLFNGLENVVYEVDIQENTEVPGLYRLVNPYGEAYPYNEPGDYDASANYYMEIHAEDPDGVYIDMQETGMDWGYGPMYVYSMAANYMAGGYTLEEVKEAGYTGTLKDGIITFPTKTLFTYMPEYDSSSLYYANYNGMFAVALPGYALPDASGAAAPALKSAKSIATQSAELWRIPRAIKAMRPAKPAAFNCF